MANVDRLIAGKHVVRDRYDLYTAGQNPSTLAPYDLITRVDVVSEPKLPRVEGGAGNQARCDLAGSISMSELYDQLALVGGSGRSFKPRKHARR